MYKKVELGEVLQYEQPTNYIVDSDLYNDEFEIPVLTAGKSFILGYTNENHNIYTKLPVIIFDDFTTATKFVDFPFKVKSSAMKILSCNENVADIRFLFYLIQTIKINSEQHQRYWISKFSKIQIPLPSLSTQKAIAEKLDKADALRKKDQELLAQYDELAQSIFIEMFGDPVKNEMGWEKVIVDKITLPIKNLGKITEPDYIEYVDISSVDNIRKKIVSTTSYKIDERPSRAQQILKAGDVLLSTVRPNLKNIAVNNCDGFIGSTGFYVFRCKNELIDENFLFEFLNSDSVTSKFEGMVSGANYPALKASDIRNFHVIIPPLALQTAFAEKIKNIELQKALVKRQAEQSEDLFQALLQESFSF
ncbi:restriction endonuclease subunit S [Amniculibacterium aquaticum]|uniref:restriction endonuclease subunit S n=1 Tax=Amniculibacterium aquaticum TaxID=2479858 RepID=UPI000F5ADEC4|nr:restriction endonuclease subunit S [Amniculibacterium aquaticum]